VQHSSQLIANNLGCCGELAQLVERCNRTAEVRDSNSLFSIVETFSE
jgi:hypothetical protein